MYTISAIPETQELFSSVGSRTLLPANARLGSSLVLTHQQHLTSECNVLLTNSTVRIVSRIIYYLVLHQSSDTVINWFSGRREERKGEIREGKRRGKKKEGKGNETRGRGRKERISADL